jgi:SHS2 domain-containing protein
VVINPGFYKAPRRRIRNRAVTTNQTIKEKETMTESITTEDLEELQSLMISESIQLEAIVNLLEKKGILTKQELEEEIEQIQGSLDTLI